MHVLMFTDCFFIKFSIEALYFIFQFTYCILQLDISGEFFLSIYLLIF